MYLPGFPAAAMAMAVVAAVLYGTILRAEPEAPPSAGRESLGSYSAYYTNGRSIIVESTSGAHLRLTAYGDYMLRVQATQPHREFLPDDWLPLIANHDLGGTLKINDGPDALIIATAAPDGVKLVLNKANLQARWLCNGATTPQLADAGGVSWDRQSARIEFAVDPHEHYAGLGHGVFGRDAAPLDLQGRTISRTYAFQAALVTPWYISNKGYGFFLNCAFPHRFRFNADGHYDVEITGADLGAQLDYVVVAGRTPLALIERYTELTGRPRLQRRAMFGLQVSDKHREEESLRQGMTWWFDNFPKLREAGIPVDAVIMDNTWRAGGGTWADSVFAFDPKRYPDPKAFQAWADRMGVIVDVDFNGPMYMQSEGWKPEYGVHGGTWKVTEKGKLPFFLANFFRADANEWLWQMMWHNVLDPKLGYPNDMVWMDETDQADVTDERAPFSNGRPWLELKNLYVLAGAKSLVEHWDRAFAGSKRPYFWFRAATAGLQRYCVYWSGDLDGTESDQATQIPAMLSAGLCGMPYYNHDAGGWQSTNEDLYRRYGIVAGSLSPVWRVHGIRGPRWPTDYGPEVVALAKRYAQFRYRLYTYLYTLSWQATQNGTPMARAMFVAYPNEAEAWKRDYQYLFGPDILVAPPVATRRDVWLPPGKWYTWTDGTSVTGGQTVAAPKGDDAAIYVRAGAVIPLCDFALSSAFIPKDRLEVDVWPGADGAFQIYEDDGTTEKYRRGESSTTDLRWDDAAQTLHIGATAGHWDGAPENRSWTVVIHGISADQPVTVDGRPAKATWDAKQQTLSVSLPVRSVGLGAEIKLTGAK